MHLSDDGSWCDGVGRFTIHSLTFDEHGAPRTAAVSFERPCAYGSRTLRGTIDFRLGDTTPPAPWMIASGGDYGPSRELGSGPGSPTTGAEPPQAGSQPPQAGTQPPAVATRSCWKRSYGRDALIRGTRRGDRLRGLPRGDMLVAGRGNDHVFGLAGDDCLVDGPGRDHLVGGSGRDVLDGGPGRDRLDCGPGHDVAIRGRGDRYVRCERIVAAVARASAGAAKRRSCAKAGDTVLRNPTARIYDVGDKVYACHLWTRRRTFLTRYRSAADDPESVRGFVRGRLAGRFVAFGDAFGCNRVGDCGASVRVVDTRSGGGVQEVAVTIPAGTPNGGTVPALPALLLRKDGAAAFVIGPSINVPWEVWRVGPAGSQRLDAGNVEPRSLATNDRCGSTGPATARPCRPPGADNPPAPSESGAMRTTTVALLGLSLLAPVAQAVDRSFAFRTSNTVSTGPGVMIAAGELHLRTWHQDVASADDGSTVRVWPTGPAGLGTPSTTTLGAGNAVDIASGQLGTELDDVAVATGPTPEAARIFDEDGRLDLASASNSPWCACSPV